MIKPIAPDTLGRKLVPEQIEYVEAAVLEIERSDLPRQVKTYFADPLRGILTNDPPTVKYALSRFTERVLKVDKIGATQDWPFLKAILQTLQSDKIVYMRA